MILCISIHILILCIRYLIKLFRLHEVRLTVTSVCMLYLSVTHIHTQNITLKKERKQKEEEKRGQPGKNTNHCFRFPTLTSWNSAIIWWRFHFLWAVSHLCKKYLHSVKFTKVIPAGPSQPVLIATLVRRPRRDKREIKSHLTFFHKKGQEGHEKRKSHPFEKLHLFALNWTLAIGTTTDKQNVNHYLTIVEKSKGIEGTGNSIERKRGVWIFFVTSND